MSPIRGLTDRQAQFPEIGQIRKGAPKPEGGKKPGADLRYFRVTFDEKEEEAAAVFLQTFGAEPDELDVLLPFNSVDENFEAWREAYVAGGLVHRCDGSHVQYEINPDTGQKVVSIGGPDKLCDGTKPVAYYTTQAGAREAVFCKPTGRLKVLIPQLHRLAYLTVLTTSLHDIMNLSRQLEALLQINGKLAGVPLKLRRRPVKISTPGEGGKRVRREKWLLSIEADPAWVKAKLLAMKAAALPGNGLSEETPLLEAPDEPEEEVPEAPEATVQAPVETKPEPEPNGNPMGDDPATQYWAAVRRAGLDHDAGAAILKECGGVLGIAKIKVETQHIPPIASGQEEMPF